MTTNPNIIISEAPEKSNEEILKSALEKIEKEADGISGQEVPAISIYNHLKEKCSGDIKFSRLVLSDDKTLSGSFSYLKETAFQKASKSALLRVTNPDNETPAGIGIGMNDTEIYEIIDNYYILSSDEIAEQKNTAEAELTELRKKADEIRKATAKKVEADKPKKPEEKKKPKEKLKSQDNESETEQLSLFEED